MSSDSKETNRFTFTWSIENFSLYDRQSMDIISSPSFSSAIFKNAKFILKLFPLGYENGNNVSCSLERVDDIVEQLTVSILFWVVDSQNSVLTGREINHTFDANKKSWMCEKLMDYDELMLGKNRFLPDDILTVNCRLRVLDSDESSANTSSVINFIELNDILLDGPNAEDSTELHTADETVIKGLRRKFCSFAKEIHGCTRILTDRNSFKWEIKNFSSCIQNQKLFITLPTLQQRTQTMVIVLHLSDNLYSMTDESEAISIEIHKTKETVESNFVKLKITVLGSPNVERESMHSFTHEKSIWKFPSPILKNVITTKKNAYLPNDVLTLQCEVFVSDGINRSWIETTKYQVLEYQNLVLAFDSNNRNLKNDFIRLYDDQELCDVTLVAQQQAFHTHKAVLFARSNVFKAMFNTSMKEKNTNIINIRDMEADTLENMLKFMYYDTLDSLDFDSALKLYSAADRYEILKLKKMCSTFLKENVTLLNIYDIIILAHLHEDNELQNMTLDFICFHKTKILESDEWIHFMKIRPKLARSILYQVCIKLPDI